MSVLSAYLHVYISPNDPAGEGLYITSASLHHNGVSDPDRVLSLLDLSGAEKVDLFEFVCFVLSIKMVDEEYPSK